MRSGSRFIEYVGRWWYIYLFFVVLGVFGNIGYLEWKKRSLDSETRAEAEARCGAADSPAKCRERVERFHEPCFERAFLWRRRNEPHVDRREYSSCLNTPPGKFR